MPRIGDTHAPAAAAAADVATAEWPAVRMRFHADSMGYHGLPPSSLFQLDCQRD